MNSSLSEHLKNCTAHRKSRETYQDYILQNPTVFPDLIGFAFTIADKDSHKGCWILEFVAYQRLNWFVPHLDFIIGNLEKLTDDSSIRPLAKICQLLVTEHFKSDSPIILSKNQLQQITEVSFDWLITEIKVATKAYSMRTLYAIGQHSDWIIPELKMILDKDYHNHSAAYKAAAREILKKIG